MPATHLAVAFAALTIAADVVFAQVPTSIPADVRASASPATHSPARTWVWGGEAELSFNPDALVTLGLRIDEVTAASARTSGMPGRRYDMTSFAALGSSGLEVQRDGPAVSGIGEGTLRFRGGLILRHARGAADLRGFVLRANPSARVGVEVADASGAVWLTADHAHYGFAADRPGVFEMRHMNLRLSEHFADALGHPEWAGYPIGNLEFRAAARTDDAGVEATDAACSAPWPSTGLTTDIELIHTNLSGFYDSIYAPRCGLPPLPSSGACTATSSNGKLVLGADASLRNAGQTAVAWYAHFSGSHPPYGNDQHPYLIWNLYRVDSAGRIKQIGASGVKHAFYSVNQNCGCADGNVIWPGCEDVYSLSSNDNGGGMQNLAPRTEIIPSAGQWGRCGSVWDANCNGAMDNGSGAQDLYQYRMQVTESDLLPPLSTGARYFFEYWYIVRDDADIYDTMGYREIQAQKNGANWSVNLIDANAPDQDFFLGPVLNRWINPDAPQANAMNEELATPLGRARIAVKVTALGGDQWRYEYAVMNFDYAHAQVDPLHPNEPNMKLLSNHGFARFSVPLPAGASVTGLRFDDADGDTGNDWPATIAGGELTWTAPAAGNTLDWGTLYHFEFTANIAPSGVAVRLVGAATPSEAELPYTLDLLGPARNDPEPPLRSHSTHAIPRVSPSRR